MANEFKIRKGLIVTGASGGTVVDIQGSQGQLFSVTDDLSGSIFAVSDISGVPIFDVNSSGLSTFAGNLSITAGVLSISSDGSNAVTFTESANGDFTIDAPDDIRLDAGGGDVVLRAGGTEYGRISMASSDLYLTSSIANRDILINPNGTGGVGIDTTSPLAKLQVGLSTSNAGNRSALAMFGAAESGILNALSLVNTTGAAATGYGTRINFHLSSNYSPTGCIEVVTEDLTSNATDSTMRFSTYGTLSGVTTYQSRLEISSAGAIKFNDYGAGTLVTDASGNITVSSGGGAGGPYLPLAGGTMTGTGNISTPDNFDIRLGNANDLQLRHLGGTSGSNIENYSGALRITNFQDDGNIQLSTDNGTGGVTEYLVLNGNTTHAYFSNPGNVGIGETNPQAKLDVQPTATNRKVTRIANDVTSTYFYNTQVDAVLEWTCASYYQAEVVITANQTNGGVYNNLYIRGIWSNNHTSHHWDELEHIGGLTGSSFTMSVGQNGTTTNSGRLELDFNYISGSFSQLNVRVTDFYGTHSYTIT